ncbi:MAG: phosphopentomutase, partial [Firmicutes bacterium]|nr:phosphopentomutase [Bacillota bacterium]
PTVLASLKRSGLEVVAVGKINDIFSGEGITKAIPTKSNDHGVEATLEQLARPFQGLLFTNLVDFDMLYGHRNDARGYADALEDFDRRLPEIEDALGEDEILIITADHGCDPTTESTDHTREYVPLLVYSRALKGGANLGVRKTYADVAATVAEAFGLRFSAGTSFLNELA